MVDVVNALRDLEIMEPPVKKSGLIPYEKYPGMFINILGYLSGFEAELEKFISSLPRDREVWAKIPGTNSLASSLGRVCNAKTLRVNQPSRGSATGILSEMSVFVNGKSKRARIGRFILSAFTNTPLTSNMLCRHLDDAPLNNTIWNLKWGTPKENSEDALRNGRFRLPDRKNKTLEENQVREVAALWERGWSAREISEKTRIKKTTVVHIVSGTSWKYLQLKLSVKQPGAHRKKFSDVELLHIQNRLTEVGSIEELARQDDMPYRILETLLCSYVQLDSAVSAESVIAISASFGKHIPMTKLAKQFSLGETQIANIVYGNSFTVVPRVVYQPVGLGNYHKVRVIYD